MTSASPLIELEGVARTYPLGGELVGLRSVTSSVSSSRFLSITGPSGSGKSTLLNILGLLDHPTAGTYRLHGWDTTALTERERAGIRSELIGFVFQSFHLIESRTVLDNVALGLMYRGDRIRDPRARAHVAIERVGMAAKAEQAVGSLSGGERQRVAIARALVSNPPLLLADEPTGNLDRRNAEQVMALLGELHGEGHTVVVVTHDPSVAQRAQETWQVQDGEVRLPGGADLRPRP